MEEYKDDDDITPLSCHKYHYFHTACLEGWMRAKVTCPLCRARINIDLPEHNAPR